LLSNNGIKKRRKGMATERKNLFTDKLPTGQRTYFFDVNQSARGTKYLLISESKREGSEYKHTRIMVFEEDFLDFCEVFKKAYKIMNPNGN